MSWSNIVIPDKISSEESSSIKENYASLAAKEFNRNEAIYLLEKYSEYLEERGYMDSDWRSEHPMAIDDFLSKYK